MKLISEYAVSCNENSLQCKILYIQAVFIVMLQSSLHLLPCSSYHTLSSQLQLLVSDIYTKSLFQFQLLLAEDGSGKGAGLVAAIALRLKQRFTET